MGDLKNKQVVILGWGVDTKDCIPWLLKKGAKITVIDRKRNLEEMGDIGGMREKLKWELGRENFGNLTKYDLIVRSPLVYRFRKEVIEAEKAGVEISSKTKLFFDYCPAKIIGVTGTKGKGTTSTLIYEMLKAAGKKVLLGGNIGLGVFGEFDKLKKTDWVVLELSSFQLIDLHKSPHVAVVLMVTQDHLDWHSSVQEYIEAKKNIVSHQKPYDFSVVNRDYPNSVEIGKAATGKKVIWVSKDQIRDFGELGDLRGTIGLRGEHNWENVIAAATAAKLAGISEEQIRKVIRVFKGLEHRLEEVATINGVSYFNDSFSTVPETTIAAIRSFKEPIILIAGGSEKGSDFSKMGKVIREAGNVKAVILIGLMADRIGKAIGQDKGLKVIKGGKNMEEIVKMAYNTATSGDIVLLSPACASFDMFKSYKERGQQFKEQVNKL